MTEWLNQCHFGDCIETMRRMPDGIVQTCVTSPPYFGLRDYGHEGQIGLEPTPDAYVAKLVEVFREVRRVMRDDGTLWLNLGDSYGGGGDTFIRGRAGEPSENPEATKADQTAKAIKADGLGKASTGLPAKNLLGIPWRVAFALQQPYYTGKVKDERDRVWLAAMLDAEGSICGTEYLTGDRTKTNIYICITNTSVPIIDKCERLFPQDVKHVYEKTNGVSNRRCFRWDVERMDTKALFIREVYPYLVAKRKQAILGYTFIEMQRGLVSKKKGYLQDQHEQRSWLMAALSKLNAGEDVDMPDWAIEPPSLDEPGFYLRQDIIYSKPNPMPESVTDRCTKAHEYIFLLSKSATYFYDHEAIKEPATDPETLRGKVRQAIEPLYVQTGDAGAGRYRANLHDIAARDTRNKRSVWTVASEPYSRAHFATFPRKLIEPCILAGAPVGGVVLDPFLGSGTTGQVAQDLGRQWIGCELNRAYEQMQRERVAQTSFLLDAA